MPLKKNNCNNCNKRGDKNKKDDTTKSEDNNNNNVGTTDAQVGEVTSDKDKTCAPSNSSSISVHLSAINETVLIQHNVLEISWQHIHHMITNGISLTLVMS